MAASPQSGQATELKKTVNFLHCTAILIALTGHIAIFIRPSDILANIGSIGGFFIFLFVTGLTNLLLALCFAEVGTIYPKAGGPYAFVLIVFGSLPGFLTMWGYVCLVSGPFWALMAYTAVVYLVKPFFPGCDPPETVLKLLSAWTLVTVVVINCLYMKYITRVQTFLSGTKMVAMLILIIAGLIQFGQGERANFDDMFTGTTTDAGGFAMAVFAGIFAYGGWQVLLSLLEEVKRPSRDVPLSLYTSFAILIGFYILNNMAYLTLLTPQEMTHSNAVALMFTDRVAPPLTPVISILVAVAAIGVLNATILGHSRVVFAAARSGHLPQVFSMINRKYLTPWPAIGLLLLISLAMLFTGSVSLLVDFISFFSTLLSFTIVCCLLYLRWSQPGIDRPLKLNLAIPISQLFVTIFVEVLAIYTRPRKMGLAILIMAAGFPVYWVGVCWKKKPRAICRISDQITRTIQCVFEVNYPQNL
ncbi:cystine/glutamate transporter-like [Liolophura sinensis]|uniref:cystine/glutamate transporter-like n=1 Tax=Liolophura sinensis TaxID=3198878 RepID=UPI0031589971